MPIELQPLFTTENTIFFTLILGCLLLGLAKSKGERSRLINALPGTAISIGILGTFFGIFMGLLGFNEDEISKSIPTLLGGMKTAFGTSLLGMFTSIMLKITFSWQDDRCPTSSDDPIKSLQKIEQAIVSCFKSDEEYSLVSQVKLIRQELIDGRRETKAAFIEFANQFSKMASESLVAELQSVVENFNVMLNELVSESFKELSVSMIQLNEWQQNYKTTIENNQTHLEKTLEQIHALETTFAATLTRIQNLDSTLESIDASLSAISTSGTELDEHSRALSNQNQLLETTIQSIRDIGKEAQAVIPDALAKMMDIGKSTTDLQNQTNEFVSQTTKELEAGVNQITSTLVDQSEKLQTTTHNFVESTAEELKVSFENLSTSTQNHLEAIENSLEQELTQSLNSLTGALASLSNKFVSDYTPLTDKLREIVSMAEASSVRKN